MTDRDKLIESIKQALRQEERVNCNLHFPLEDDVTDLAQAALAAIEAQGLAVVPVEPTEAMISSAENFITLRGIWDAMIQDAQNKETSK